jgi:hypothetical protein
MDATSSDDAVGAVPAPEGVASLMSTVVPPVADGDASGAPQLRQNFAPSRIGAPHAGQDML